MLVYCCHVRRISLIKLGWCFRVLIAHETKMRQYVIYFLPVIAFLFWCWLHIKLCKRFQKSFTLNGTKQIHNYLLFLHVIQSRWIFCEANDLYVLLLWALKVMAVVCWADINNRKVGPDRTGKLDRTGRFSSFFFNSWFGSGLQLSYILKPVRFPVPIA